MPDKPASEVWARLLWIFTQKTLPLNLETVGHVTTKIREPDLLLAESIRQQQAPGAPQQLWPQGLGHHRHHAHMAVHADAAILSTNIWAATATLAQTLA